MAETEALCRNCGKIESAHVGESLWCKRNFWTFQPEPFMHEDELPANMPKADYELWYAKSYIPGGVGCRVGPIYPQPEAAASVPKVCDDPFSQHPTGVTMRAEPSRQPEAFMSAEPIKPIGLRIIDHPKLSEWTARGQASQESDGLWLHYSVVCTLLKELAALEHQK